MKAIIADDEPTLAEYLKLKLGKLWPELEIIGIAHSGRDALSQIESKQPDVAFLDIHMPGLSGLQVAEQMPETTRVVFVTAFDEYAVEAFQKAAIDYLLKPVTEDRLRQTIERLRQVETHSRQDLLQIIKQLAAGEREQLHWLKAQKGETTTLIAVADVVYFKSSQKYTEVYTRDQVYLIRQSVRELEQILDSSEFWRIHRSVLVRVAEIESAVKDFGGKYLVKLCHRGETLVCSKRYAHLFRQS